MKDHVPRGVPLVLRGPASALGGMVNVWRYLPGPA